MYNCSKVCKSPNCDFSRASDAIDICMRINDLLIRTMDLKPDPTILKALYICACSCQRLSPNTFRDLIFFSMVTYY